MVVSFSFNLCCWKARIVVVSLRIFQNESSITSEKTHPEKPTPSRLATRSTSVVLKMSRQDIEKL